jgi:hypothetical protein
MVAVAGGTVAVSRLMAGRAPAAAAGEQEPQAERLARLESSLANLQRNQAHAGAQAGAALAARLNEVANAKASPEGPVPEDVATQRAREQKQFARFDQLARTGDGTAVAAQLRKNIEEMRKLPKDRNPGELDVKGIDCGATMCRVEVNPKGDNAAQARTAAFVLGRGMGTLTMQPFAADKPAVYYVMAPGMNLPLQP